VNAAVTLRPMTLEDVPTVAELDRISFSLPWPERSFRFELTENESSICWVAEADGRIIGMLVMWVILDEAHIATVAIHPDYRRQGIGEHFLREMLKAARDEGAVRATLEVRVGNVAAQEMYRKFGFETVGTRPRYYKDNNEDAILLTLPSLENLG